jgi:hypothetical protein
MSNSFDLLAAAAPKQPALTCPKIDAVIDELNYAKDLIDGVPTDQAMSAFNILADLIDDSGLLETVRAANDQLRRNGTYWYRTARKLSDENAVLRAEVARLRGEKTDLDWTHVIR